MSWTRAGLLEDFRLDFKASVLSHLDKLLGLPYVDRNLEMSSFHPNLNHNKIPLIGSVMV